MERRSFLKGLLAIGVASTVASPIVEALAAESSVNADVLSETILKLNVNGKVTSIASENVGNGWFRISKTFFPNGKNLNVSISHPDGADDDWYSLGMIDGVNPDNEHRFSLYVKPEPEAETASPNENGIRCATYINTGEGNPVQIHGAQVEIVQPDMNGFHHGGHNFLTYSDKVL